MAKKRKHRLASSARGFLVLTATVVAAISASAKGADRAIAGDDTRTMEIRVRDEGGQPIQDARLYVGVWYMEDFDGGRVRKDHVTNSDGLVTLRIPRRLKMLRLWASKAAFVPEFVTFAEGTHDEGKRIPDRFEFELARGTKLSGTVIDESGDPISGVTVNVRVDVSEPAWWTVNHKPIISTWLTAERSSAGPISTDIDGRWQIDNAPAPVDGRDFEFRLMYTHKEFVSDFRWSELQREQGLTTKMLRDGTARLKMKRGVSVVGTVVDSSGNPVSEGQAIWNDNGVGAAAVSIDPAGRFETLPLPPGEHPFTITVPGFQPERRTIAVAESMGEVEFTLHPGKRLTLKIVNAEGRPVSNAHVAVRKWRGATSLHNDRIPRRSDESGMYVWDWAPADAVTYQIWANGFSSNTVTLIANETQHVIELVRPLIASGQVTDATTGKPIKAFRVIPVTVFRPKFLSTSFQDQRLGKDGQYEIELSRNGEYDYRYQVRIEADGYRSALSEKTFGMGDDAVTQHFSLESAEEREGRVVDQHGEPVASASIIQCTPSIVPSMRNGQAERSDRDIETSADGRFQIAATFEPVRIRVTHISGFAETLRGPNEAIGTIQLQSWASVSGRLQQDGKPVPGETIYFFPVVQGRLEEPRFQGSYSARTDPEGRFEFERLPPVAGSMRAYLGPWDESRLTSSQAVPLDLKPGERRTITLGGDGVTLTGRVVATGRGDAPLNKNWSLNYLVRRDGGIALPDGFPELSFDAAGPVHAAWFIDPNCSAWLTTRENYFVKLTPDGRFRISGVPPGTYDLVLRLYEQPAGCLVETIGQKVVTIEVTDSEAASGTKDNGTIEVLCRAGPRVGESMRLYNFTDTSGRERSIQEMNGRYVLMHVWASWCAPCLESIPDIQATINSHADQPITLVGLNIDEDPSNAKALARKADWNWPQSYLGDDSDMARQLAISSVPTYFLIGPDGSLAASATDWWEFKKTLTAALDGSPD